VKNLSYLFILLLAVCAFSCGGGSSGSRQVDVSWTANNETNVNKTGGGYTLYYSKQTGFDINDAYKIELPYESGSAAPTTTTINLTAGTTWYLRVVAYGVWGGNTVYSEPCNQVAVNVGG